MPQFIQKGFIQGLCLKTWGRLVIARAVALFGAGMQGELGNDQDVTLHVHDGTIHQAINVIKDPHFTNFLRDVGQV